MRQKWPLFYTLCLIYKKLKYLFLIILFQLNSVEELKSLKLDETTPKQSQSASSTTTTDQAPTSSIPPPPPPLPPTSTLASPQGHTEPTATAAAVSDTAAPPPPPQAPSNPVREDPRYIKYFKMLKMGVAEEAGIKIVFSTYCAFLNYNEF